MTKATFVNFFYRSYQVLLTDIVTVSKLQFEEVLLKFEIVRLAEQLLN